MASVRPTLGLPGAPGGGEPANLLEEDRRTLEASASPRGAGGGGGSQRRKRWEAARVENTFAGFPGEPLASWGKLGAVIRAKDRDACSPDKLQENPSLWAHTVWRAGRRCSERQDRTPRLPPGIQSQRLEHHTKSTRDTTVREQQPGIRAAVPTLRHTRPHHARPCPRYLSVLLPVGIDTAGSNPPCVPSKQRDLGQGGFITEVRPLLL